jgi:hypothetical protein
VVLFVFAWRPRRGGVPPEGAKFAAAWRRKRAAGMSYFNIGGNLNTRSGRS